MAKGRRFRRFAWLVALPVVTACGGNSQAVDKRVRELEAELTRLQNDNDRLGERVSSLELQRAAAAETPKHAEAEAEEPAALERPPLKVIRMGPGQASGSRTAGTEGAAESKDEAAAEKPAPDAEPTPDPRRPVLRMRGNRGGVRQGSGQPSQS